MNFKALIGSVVISSITLVTAVPSTYQTAHLVENFNVGYADTYDVSIKEITTVDGVNFKVIPDVDRNFRVEPNNVIGAGELPPDFYGDKGYAAFYVDNQQVWDQVASVYGFNKDTDRFEIAKIMRENAIVDVFMRIRLGSYPFPTGKGVWVIENFTASVKPKPPKDNIPLPDDAIDFTGTYKYSDIIKNLDYLMIKRKDFDKFDYSYLYWVPIFNFLYETQMDRRTTISVDGLNLKDVNLNLIIADETKLTADRSFRISVDNKLFEIKSKKLWVLEAIEFNLSINGIDHTVDLIFLTQTALFQFFNDFLNVFFGNITYLGNNYNFLRYDSFLNQDFLGFMNYWVDDAKMVVTGNDIDWFKNYANNDMYASIYKVLGDFFYSMFYATFDMDPSTRVKVDFHSDSDSWKEKNYYFEIGFLYRSLITFYPKQYLLNGSYEGDNKHVLFRSFYFLYDEKKHNGFVSGKTNYFISFNVLKMYDNLMFNMPNSASSTTINRFDANFDVQYGINIFTVSFPLLTTIAENPKYTFYINDFNILNSTAFIPDNPDDSDSDLIPIPDCSPSILSANGWSCILRQTTVKVINFLAKITGLNVLLKPIVTISQTVVDFFGGAFAVFHAVPALSYLFQFMIGFSLFVIIFRFFV